AYLFLPQVGSILTSYGFGVGCHPPRPIPQKAGTHFEKKTLRSSQAHKEINQKKRIEYWEKIRDVEP
ncbi:hypothetical protein QUA72_23875, partial [Microcoleus sp. M2_B4]